MFQKRVVNLVPISLIDKYMSYSINYPNKISRLLRKSNPLVLEDIGKRKAIYMFKKASKEITHYATLLKKKHVNADKVKTFDDFLNYVPIIDKKSYVQKSKYIRDMVFNKHISEADILVRSSGFSGKPCTWPKSRDEEANEKKRASFGLRYLYNTDKYKTLLINGFALGSWVSGVDLLKISDDECTIINPGLVEEEVLEIFKDFKEEFDQTIIAGNPSFLRNMIENGIKKGIKWKKHRLNILTGGESITENWREYLYKLIGSQPFGKKGYIYSAFGASDVGITGINETPDTVFIRRKAWKNSKIQKTIFNTLNVLPMLFQYDPTKYYVETNNKNELIFTTCNFDVMMPLIRYNLHDTGGIIPYNQMKLILKRLGINHKIAIPWPFMYIIGRSDGALSFHSSLIYPQNIRGGIFRDKNIAKKTTGKFKIDKIFDKYHISYLAIEIQLKPRVKPNKFLEKRFSEEIEKHLFIKNKDFRDDYQNIKKNFRKKSVLKVTLVPFRKYKLKYNMGIKTRYKK